MTLSGLDRRAVLAGAAAALGSCAAGLSVRSVRHRLGMADVIRAHHD